VNDRLDFVLTVIKRDYNTNDRLKFILPFIRWENGLNDRLKLIKNGRKENWKWTKWRWKLKNKKWIESLGFENLPVEERRTNEEQMKNDGKPSQICSRKRLGSVTEAPRLGFSSRKQFFSPKTAEMHSQGDQGSLQPSHLWLPECYGTLWIAQQCFLSTPDMSRNFTDCLTMDVKYLKAVKRRLHATKQWSPDEIRVWHTGM